MLRYPSIRVHPSRPQLGPDRFGEATIHLPSLSRISLSRLVTYHNGKAFVSIVNLCVHDVVVVNFIVSGCIILFLGDCFLVITRMLERQPFSPRGELLSTAATGYSRVELQQIIPWPYGKHGSMSGVGMAQRSVPMPPSAAAMLLFLRCLAMIPH